MPNTKLLVDEIDEIIKRGTVLKNGTTLLPGHEYKLPKMYYINNLFHINLAARIDFMHSLIIIKFKMKKKSH
jgi:hypothetical protein